MPKKKRFSTDDDVAMNALAMDASSFLQWFSSRTKVGTNFDPGALEHVFSLASCPFSVLIFVERLFMKLV